MDRPGVRKVPEGSGEQGKMEKTGCKIICGAPTTLAVKGLMIMKQRTNKNKQKPTYKQNIMSAKSKHSSYKQNIMKVKSKNSHVRLKWSMVQSM